ncbi:hypothetical protein [Streptosporangium subroseum]|uniref:hypothetical protein n=1 Tax=Streptosporangium subroseum TaxID=106412 RepID=UPI00308A3085|nr:hypothetical protein OHB15_36250 [Streptosporangium subroseum]
MRRRLPLVVAGWLITGFLATGAGVAVIGLLGEPLTGSALRPLSSAEINEALAGTTPQAVAGPTADPAPTPAPPASSTSVSPAPTPTPSSSASAAPVTGRSGVIDTAGGSVIARCEDGLVTLRAWSPAQGFHVEKVERGPADRARVEFESDETKAKVEVRCSADGSPVHRIHD